MDRRLAGMLPVLAVAATVIGCADMHYRRIELGQTKQQYERILPAAHSRRTDLGMSYLESDWTGRTDAIVIWAARDRRAAGKLHATCFRRNYGFKTEIGFRLRGEIDPQLADLASTGPLDSLRVVLQQLENYRGEKAATDAHDWLIAGLVRLLERWPHMAERLGPLKAGSVALEMVPAGGKAVISVDRRGVYRFEYQQGAVR